MENHVEKHEDNEKNDGQDHFQAFLRSHLELIFADPFVGVSGRQMESLLELVVCGAHEIPVVLRLEIDIDVAGEGRVLVADHGRPSRERDSGHLFDRNLGPGWCANQNSAQLIDIVPEVSVVADIDRIPLAPFDIFRDHSAADTGTDRLLDIGNGQAVTGGLLAVHFDVDVKPLRDAFREDGANVGKGRKGLLDLRARLLDPCECGPLNLHAERRFDSGEFHVQPVFDRHGPCIRETRELQFGVHLLDQLFVGHSGPPFLPWLEHDGRVVHVERRVIRRAVRPANGSKNRIDFREGAKDTVLFLQQLRSLTDRDSRQGGRHVKSRALKERRHELAADLECQRKRDDEKDQIEQQGCFSESETQAQKRKVERLRDPGNRIPRFWSQTPANEKNHQNGHQRDCEHRRETDGESLSPREGTEHASFLRLEQKHRKKRNHDDQKRKENSGRDLFGRVEKNLLALRLGNRRRCACLMFRELAIAVLNHNNGCIDQNTDSQGQASKRHDVGTDVQLVHRDERGDHRDRQREDGDQRGPDVKQEDDDDDANDDGLLQQVALEGFDGSADQPGTVVTGDVFHTRRQRGFDVHQLFLHTIDYVQRVHAIAHDHDARDGFSLALPLGDSFADVRTEANRTEVANSDRCSVFGSDGDGFEIAERAQIAQATNHVLRAAHFENASTDFVRAGANFLQYGRQRN